MKIDSEEFFMVCFWLFIIICLVITPFLEYISEKRTCRNQATAMGFNYEYEWFFIGENVCTYVLPDGKRILSTKYRALED